MVALPSHLSPLANGSGKSSRELTLAYQRERVLVAATEVFAKRGYRQTSVDQIVAAGNIGLSAFYEIFEGKEDCFLQALDRVYSTGRAYLEAATSPGLPWAEQAARVLRALLEFVAADPHGTRLALVEVHTAGATARERYELVLGKCALHLRGGHDASPFGDRLPERIDVAVIGGLSWFLQQRAAAGTLDNVIDSLPEVVRMVVGPYMGEAEASRAVAAAESAVESA